MEFAGKKTVTIGTYVPKPIDRIWELWTNPDHIKKWNSAGVDWHCPNAVNDLKPGGKFNWRMENVDGSDGFDFSGTFRKISDKHKIILKLDDDRMVTIDFTRLENGTKITETFEVEDENSIENQRKGWQAILDNFKVYAMNESADNP
ncbi:SRPBCC domain-containing protein [Christiangramia sabulilitoris]|uniref:Activator of HSP90 ATPase n=1 Tax=Christiangramia sabulilitoris TaxID=2583991 RepID=A0A550I0A6_9FLAO|nr:SRPBCC domain-containing protein [Christiangramia sabulilitoris]TRO64370.1 activator of HSP90 ATPase [Christiangramia sabulilitoris]